MDINVFVKVVLAYFAYAAKSRKKADWFIPVFEVFIRPGAWYELALYRKIMIFLRVIWGASKFGENSQISLTILEECILFLIQVEGNGNLEDNLDVWAYEIYEGLAKENGKDG